MSILAPTPRTLRGWDTYCSSDTSRPHVLISRSNRQAADWEVPEVEPMVVDVVRRQMASLGKDVLGESGLNERTMSQVVVFLRKVSDARTTFPSIVPDDDGVAMLH